MNNFIWKFILVSFSLLSITFFIHYEIVKRISEDFNLSYLVICYVTNYLIAVLIFIVIDKLKTTQTALIGYIFLFGSLFKFLVYFVLIYPILTEDEPLTKLKFFFFFIPYVICLITEVAFLAKLLNMNEKNT